MKFVYNGQELDLGGPTPANYVQEYSTEDGWTVRKHSDGYVEQTYKKTVTIPIDAWTSIVVNDSESGVYATNESYFPSFALPVPLVAKFGEFYDLFAMNWSVMAAHTGVAAANQVNQNTHVDHFAIYRMGTKITSPLTCTLTVFINGRWK